MERTHISRRIAATDPVGIGDPIHIFAGLRMFAEFCIFRTVVA